MYRRRLDKSKTCDGKMKMMQYDMMKSTNKSCHEHNLFTSSFSLSLIIFSFISSDYLSTSHVTHHVSGLSIF